MDLLKSEKSKSADSPPNKLLSKLLNSLVRAKTVIDRIHDATADPELGKRQRVE